MPGTLTPAQMFDHSMVELSGRSTMHALDFAAPVTSTTAAPKIYTGSVMTLDSAGNLEVGLGIADPAATAVAAHWAPMAIFAIQGEDDFDANSDVGNMSGGVVSGIVASGGYEIQTTEYVSGTYYPNDLLTFATSTNRGKVTIASNAYTLSQNVGVVSRIPAANADGKMVISFWSIYLPAQKVA